MGFRVWGLGCRLSASPVSDGLGWFGMLWGALGFGMVKNFGLGWFGVLGLGCSLEG